MSNTKVKIVHLTSVHAQGDTRIFHKECRFLANAGFDITLIVPNAKSQLENGVKIVTFPWNRTSRIKRMIFAVNKVFRLAVEQNADIYHLHDPELLRIAPRLLRLGKKVVYDAHEDVPRQVLAKSYLPLFTRRFISSFMEKWENRRVKKLSGVVTATPFIRERFLQINPNTVDVNNYPILAELLQDIPRQSGAERRLCYVGGITRVRGIVELITAMEHIDGELLLAGKFQEPGLREEVEKLPGWKKTRELGFLDRSAVKDIYSGCAIGMVTLHPTLNYIDSLPVKMFEYMISEMAVVASDFSFWKPIITDTGAGLLVNPMQPEKIAEAVNYLIHHPEITKKMGEAGHQLVMDKYNFDREFNKLTKLYATILEAK